jgi:hypothetical protein
MTRLTQAEPWLLLVDSAKHSQVGTVPFVVSS